MSRCTSPSKLNELVSQVRDLDDGLARQQGVRDIRCSMLEQYQDELRNLQEKNHVLRATTEKLDNRLTEEKYKNLQTAQRDELKIKKFHADINEHVRAMRTELQGALSEERRKRQAAEDQVSEVVMMLTEQFRTALDMTPPPNTTFLEKTSPPQRSPIQVAQPEMAAASPGVPQRLNMDRTMPISSLDSHISSRKNSSASRTSVRS